MRSPATGTDRVAARKARERLDRTNPWLDWVRLHNPTRPRLAPFPAQQALFDAAEKYVLYTGGMRGGKTVAGAMKALRVAAWWPGIPVLVARKTGPSLERYTVPVYQDCLPASWGGKYFRSDRRIELPNHSNIWFVALEDETDLSKMRGADWSLIHWDEPTEGTEEHFRFLQTRLTHLVGPRQMLLTSNNAGRGWMYDFFSRKADKHCRVIETSSFENAALPPDVVEQFKRFPPNYAKKFLFGGFSNIEGQYFTHFSREMHCVAPMASVPSHWPLWRGMDTGWDHPTAAVLLTMSERGDIIVLDEYAERHRPPNEHAAALLDRHARWGPVQYTVIDPAARGQGVMMGQGSVMDALVQSGLYAMPLPNRDVFAGLAQMSLRFSAVDHQDEGGLFICANCERLIDQIIGCEIYSTQAGTERVRQGQNDLLDALRYGVMTAPARPEPEEAEAPPRSERAVRQAAELLTKIGAREEWESWEQWP